MPSSWRATPEVRSTETRLGKGAAGLDMGKPPRYTSCVPRPEKRAKKRQGKTRKHAGKARTRVSEAEKDKERTTRKHAGKDESECVRVCVRVRVLCAVRVGWGVLPWKSAKG